MKKKDRVARVAQPSQYFNWIEKREQAGNDGNGGGENKKEEE